MMRWFLNAGALDASAKRTFASLDSVFALEGEQIAADPLS